MTPRERAWRRWVPFWNASVSRRVDDELRFHLEERIAELREAGVPPEVARARAEGELGDVDEVRAALRAIDDRIARRRAGAEWWRSAAEDLHYAVRTLRRAPALAAMVVATLGLGVGANAAMFSFIDRVFLAAPSGVAAPDAVSRVFHTRTQNMIGGAFTTASLSYPEYAAFESAARAEGAVAVYELRSAKLRIGNGAAHEARAVFASAAYFPLLGVRVARGRAFAADEAGLEGAARVAVLSDALWHRAFGGGDDAIGKTVELDGERFTVIGVAPPGFTGADLDAADLFLPLGTRPTPSWSKEPWYRTRNIQGLRMLLRPRASGDLRRFAARATVEFRRLNGARFVDSTSTVSTSGLIAARGPGKRAGELDVATRVAGVTAIVLLIACANVANLLLARAVSRRREIAVRLALGISRGRLVRLLLAEGVVLAAAAGAVALLVAAWGGAALRALLLPAVHWARGPLDWRVVSFTLGIAVAAGLAAALAPASGASRTELTGALRTGVREGFGRRSRLRSALVVAQAALSVVLLVGAGLFVRSVREVEAIDLGWDADRIVLASVSYGETQRVTRDPAAMPALADRARRIPGVELVALTSVQPMWGFSFLKMKVPGRDSMPMNDAGPPTVAGISPEFFAATGLRIVRGRGITADDRPSGSWGVVVNETMARTIWPGEDAVGKCLGLGVQVDACHPVIGVVEDAHRDQIVQQASAMQFFVPLGAFNEFPPSALVVRAAPARMAGVVAALQRDIAAAFPAGEPNVQPMDALLAPQLRPWRLGATLFTVFGVLALVVAAIGIYSTVSYSAAQRTHEFGVRVALGAQAGDVLRLVVGGGVRVVASGVAAGVVLSLAAGRLVAALLYGTSPRDPAVIAAVAIVLLLVAALASLRPAWKASRGDAVEALRAE